MSGKIDIASILPPKGDPRRPPEWLPHALLYTGITAIGFMLIIRSFPAISWILADIIISAFLALAMDPIITWLTKRTRCRRTIITACTWTVIILIMTGLIILFGSMFINQITGLVKSMPSTYSSLQDAISGRFSYTLPSMNTLLDAMKHNLQTEDVSSIAGTAIGTVSSIGHGFLSLMMIIILTYYIAAYQNTIAITICSRIRENGQRRFLKTWYVISGQISAFLYSRIILAIANSIVLSIIMIILHIPYWLPLSIFCGIVSQFIPTIGTYIGGALPVLSTFGSNGVKTAIIILIYIIIYQQFENLILSPLVSRKTMDINPAIALLAVFIFGALFGALGAFIALPITGALQTMMTLYTKKHDVIQSDHIPQR